MDIGKLPYSEHQLREILNTNIIGFLSRKIGHDINNHLTGIYGYANLAYKNCDETEKLHLFLDRISECSVKAQDTISLLMSLTDQTAKQSDMDAGMLVERTLDIMNRFRPGECTFNNHPIKQDTTFEIPGTGFQDILMWLILWALHQCDDAQILSVRVSNDSACGPIEALQLVDHVHLIIESYEGTPTESGSSFPSLIGAPNTSFFENTHHVTELLASSWGGIVSYISKDDGGAIAQLSFRRTRLFQPTEHNGINQFGSGKPSRPLLILLLEDQEMISDFITMLLQEDGHEVITFSNGKELEAELDNLPLDAIDVCLFDIFVPGITGLDAARLIRQRNEDANLLFYSALTDIAEVEKHFTLNQRTRFLQKPFQNEELMLMLEQFA